ncbi:hypothetical protein AZ012_001186 [Citrobacter amalonaticus]|nr:hypothetical protein AZ012_001186 [Citrobacter amalonaticus]
MLMMKFYTDNANNVLLKIVCFGTQEWTKLKLNVTGNIRKMISGSKTL